jgi:hypothetical protein
MLVDHNWWRWSSYWWWCCVVDLWGFPCVSVAWTPSTSFLLVCRVCKPSSQAPRGGAPAIPNHAGIPSLTLVHDPSGKRSEQYPLLRENTSLIPRNEELCEWSWGGDDHMVDAYEELVIIRARRWLNTRIILGSCRDPGCRMIRTNVPRNFASFEKFLCDHSAIILIFDLNIFYLKSTSSSTTILKSLYVARRRTRRPLDCH